MSSVTKTNKPAAGIKLLQDHFLHSSERIKSRLDFFADREIIWPINGKRLHCYCTLSRMISYPLLLNEHKKTYVFGLVSMTKFKYLISTHPVCFFHTFFLRQSKDQECFSPCTWFLNMMPAEPGASIKYMRTQICTFCQSEVDSLQKQGAGFPKT